MPETDRPGYSFGNGPPREFLRRKENRPSFHFREVEPEEHAVAFTVAKSAGFDILDDVREELQRALDAGETFEVFRKRLRPRLVAKGWWGRAELEGPDGTQRVLLGSNRRLRTIYRANMRSARAAGQWQRIERTKRLRPYLLYQLGPSERHRPLHEAKNGWVHPVDHPFWDQWFPPNGWGCKCWVRQIGRAEAERIGISPDPAIPTRKHVNPATGEIRELPAGLDPAWAGNPGKTRLANVEKLLGDKLTALPPEAQAVAARDLAGSWRARRIHEGDAPGSVPVAVLPPEAAGRLGAATRVVTYSADSAAHMRDNAGKRLVDFSALEALHAAVTGEEAYLDDARDGPPRLVAFTPLWRFVLKRTGAGDELFLLSWNRTNARQRATWRKRNE